MSEEPHSIACEICEHDSVPGLKYCAECKKAVIAKAKRDGLAYEDHIAPIFSDARGRKPLRSYEFLRELPDMRECEGTVL